MQLRMIDMEVNTTLVQCYPAHEALPDGPGPFPAVVVMHGPFGLNDAVRAASSRLAREGFYVLTPDFYATPVSFAGVAPDFMRGATGGAIEYSDEELARARASAVSDDRAGEIIRQAIAYAGTRSHARSGGAAVVGFSTGGRWALFAACERPDEVKACVAFYPAELGDRGAARPSLLDRLGKIRCPVLVFSGGLDGRVSAPQREALRASLAHLGSDFDMQVFREAGHDFFDPNRDTCDISASRAAWAATLGLLKRAT